MSLSMSLAIGLLCGAVLGGLAVYLVLRYRAGGRSVSAIGKELDEHEQRMLSMCEAAMDEEAFRILCSSVDSKDLRIEKAMPLQIKGEELPVAWMLQATQASEAGSETTAD